MAEAAGARLTREERGRLFPPEDHPGDPRRVSFEQKLADLEALDGERVRLTYPTGDQVSGEVEIRDVAVPTHVLANLKPEHRHETTRRQRRHGGREMTGELRSVAKVEVMQPNGRYRLVHDYGQTVSEWREVNDVPMPSEVEAGLRELPKPTARR